MPMQPFGHRVEQPEAKSHPDDRAYMIAVASYEVTADSAGAVLTEFPLVAPPAVMRRIVDAIDSDPGLDVTVTQPILMSASRRNRRESLTKAVEALRDPE